ncbi:MAG: hypothetical protein PUC11_06550 [Elusimicrobia bacterium]|nr:hypothetical protein [Elusimicrobiota bacterium]
MNATLFRKARRILAAANCSAAEAFLMRAFALAWASSVTRRPVSAVAADLSDFLPPEPTVSPKSARQVYALLSAAVAGQEGTKNAFTPEILALVHEHTAPNARSNGIFYTPWPAAQRLTEETLDGWLSCAAKTPQTRLASLTAFTACDPAAGAGGLLLPLWLTLAQRQRSAGDSAPMAALLTEISNRLYAADLDANALQTLRLRAALTFYARTGQKPPKTLFSNLLPGDALAGDKISVWREKFPRVFASGGFDAVLCNPPYVGQKNNKALFERLRRQTRWKPHISPKGDLLYLFFHLALEVLKPGGVGGFLTTAYFARAASAAGLRARLKEEAAFLRLVDFRSTRLFARAPGQHNLISVFQKTDEKPLCRVGEENQPVAQEALYNGPTHFLNTAAQDETTASLLKKMAAAPLRLKDVAAVSNGLMTGCDKISAAHLSRHHLPGVRKGDGVFVLSQAEKDALNLSPAELTKLKPFFKNSDISPYAPHTAAQYWLVDFFYPNDRETDFSVYPHLTAHLARFKPVLLARKQNNNGIDQQLKKGVYWFGSVRRKMDFDADKLAAPQRARANTFAFAPGPWYASSDVYFISAPKPGFSLWYLLALFNSAPYYAWLFHNGKRKGNLLELYSQPLSELPVPQAQKNQQNALETLAKGIYRKKQENPAADISREEEAVNLLVGTLFGLTPRELARAIATRLK